MGIAQVIFHEILAHEKLYGKKPRFLILADKNLRNEFFTEAFEIIMENEGLDFETPSFFCGVPFFFKNITIYGGDCKWMLVGE